jgi:tetratricopeptide (TPR) repeat protein
MPVEKIILGSIGLAIEWMMQQATLSSVVRVVCPPRFAEDPVGQGNVLAGAINHDLKLELLGQGLSWTYATTLLRLHQHTLGPFTMMVFCAENAQEMALDLMALEQVQLFLHFSSELPEALAGSKNIVELAAKPKGKPTRPRTLPALRLRLNGDLQRGSWVAALSIAAPHFPEELPGLLRKCGWSLMAEGFSHRLEQELSKVEGEFARHPEVLRWRLAAAFDSWSHAELLPLVGQVLQECEHPELRSYYALGLHSLYRFEESQQQIEMALASGPSAVVLANAGYIAQYRNLERSFIYLSEALKQAELENAPFLQTQISLFLAQGNAQSANPQKAYEWAQWAIRVMEHNRLNNTPLRLMVLNELSFARVMLGDTLGLVSQLKQEATCVAGANRRVQNFLDSTMAEALLVEGRAGEAMDVMDQLWERILQRESFSIFVIPYAVACLEAGEINKAWEVAKKAETLNQDSQPVIKARTRLAKLAIRGLSYPSSVIEELTTLLENFAVANAGIEQVQTGLYLARAHLVIGNTEEADLLLSNLQPILSRFSMQGLRALVGPSEAFAELFARLVPREEALELEFMGRIRARLNGKTLNLRPRQADVLAAMALKPSGHTVEQMALDIYGERGSPASARAEIHRLADLVPIESKPYRLGTAYKADFLEIKKYLSIGDMRGALNLFRGPLLPQSSAPVVEEERYRLEDYLREAVVQSGDPEAILALTEMIRDDLELLELAAKRLPHFDPRRAVTEALRRQAAKSWVN